MTTTTLSHRRSVGGPPHAIRLLLACSVSAILAGGITPAAQANGMHAAFNPDFLQGSEGREVDVSRFARGNPVASGSYRLDVYINQNWMGRQDVRVQESADSQAPSYCFKHSQLAGLGIDASRLPETIAALETDCVDIVRQVPSALAEFDLATLRLDLSIPQAFLNRAKRGYVDPHDWEVGVTAAFIDYNASAFHNDTGNQDSTQYFAGINAGLNLGSWRLRHNGSYSRSSSPGTTRTHYVTTSNYAQRDLIGLKSQLTAGAYYTPADLFDSVPYVGVQLASDDRMLPDSQRGFAPTVRGTTDSNAKVTIRQGRNVLYETSVAPGPFVIDDLHNTGYSGDLEVTVTEADGRNRSFTVPFASVAQLLRPGASRYSVTAGKYRDDRLANEPGFVQGTYQRGISNQWTGYVGGIFAGQYTALQGGLALSTRAGAFAADVTHSSASQLALHHGLGTSTSGQSYRLSYSKLVESTRTNFVVAAYRFSSDGYLGFADYAQAQDNSALAPKRQRNRLQVNVNQPLAEGHGHLFLSGSSQTYWKTGRSSDTSYQAGYSNSYRWGSFNVSANRARMNRGPSDTQYMVSVSLPLGRSNRSTYLTNSTTYSDQGELHSQLGASGTLGLTNQLSYSAHASHSRADGNSNSAVGGNVQYRAPSTNLSGSYSHGGDYQQLGLGVSGSVVMHRGGLVFSQSQGETRVIVEARGAEGARLLNSSGAQVDSRGYGLVSSLMPYRQNEVALDPKGIADNVELQLTSQNIAPRYGAVVVLKYPTATGEPVLLTVRDEQGQALPVGAEVIDADGNSMTLLGQGSRLFFRASEAHGALTVRWGQSSDRQCQVHYTLPPLQRERQSSFIKAEASCIRPTAPTQTTAH